MTNTIDLDYLQKQIKKTKNLKERVRLCAILAKANGHSAKVIASVLDISESTVYEYVTEFEKNKKVKHKDHPGRSCKLSLSQEADLKEYISMHSYSTLQGLCAYIEEKYQVQYTPSGLRDWLKRKKIIKQKRHLTALRN